MNRISLTIVLLGFIFVLPAEKNCQAQERHSFLPDSKLWISGDSNRSFWIVELDDFSGWIDLSVDEAGSFYVHGAELTVAARKIKSDRGIIMNRLMYRALKTNEHETITYILASAERVEGASADSVYFATVGNLTLAGITNEIEFVIASARSEDTYYFRGVYPMKMTEYGMEPPVAMFGALHTRDDVTVHFEWVVGTN